MEGRNRQPGRLVLEQGADTLELDLVISKDKKVVVSHEPWFSFVISTGPDGKAITKEDEKQHNIYAMTYDKIKKYDVGSRGNAGFPLQVAMKVNKPLLDYAHVVLRYTWLYLHNQLNFPNDFVGLEYLSKRQH